MAGASAGTDGADGLPPLLSRPTLVMQVHDVRRAIVVVVAVCMCYHVGMDRREREEGSIDRRTAYFAPPKCQHPPKRYVQELVFECPVDEHSVLALKVKRL